VTAATAGAGIRTPARPQRAITVAIMLAAATVFCGVVLEESALPTRAVVVWTSLFALAFTFRSRRPA
jgi:hypothetical protein